MSITSYIQSQKESFRRYKTAKARADISKENVRLNEERQHLEAVRQRQIENERLRAGNVQLQKSMPPPQPSGIQRFGQGLAKVMNKTKSDIKDAKSQGYMKGIDFGGSKPSAGRAGSKLARINQGSTGLAFGGNTGGNNPFSSGQRNLEYGRPEPVVRQASRPKTKTVFRY
jgi:hypothetical protein